MAKRTLDYADAPPDRSASVGHSKSGIVSFALAIPAVSVALTALSTRFHLLPVLEGRQGATLGVVVLAAFVLSLLSAVASVASAQSDRYAVLGDWGFRLSVTTWFILFLIILPAIWNAR